MAVQTIEAIKKFIISELLTNSGSVSIGDLDPLIESGIIDSFGIMTLITFMEKEFCIHLSSDDLIPENFTNLAAIANLVDKKLESGGGKT